MELKPVKSSVIAGVGFEKVGEKTGNMTIEFMSGKKYNFENIPCDLHEQMMAAPSIGSFFSRNIKGRVFQKEVEPVVEEKIPNLLENL